MRVMVFSDPYVASATAIDPVVSTATMTSVALMACEVVDDTTLGVSTITATMSSISVRRMQAHTVSSLEARRRTNNTISRMASTASPAASSPPATQPKAGEKVNPFIASTSMHIRSR